MGNSDGPEPPSSGQDAGKAQSQEDMLNEAFNTFTMGNGATPSLPPAMAAMQGKSSAEILEELNKSPLFMTELEENDDLEAFKALAYEGPPAEVGKNFKEQGNECFKAGKWADAKEFYTKAIQVLQGEQRKRSQEAKKYNIDTPEIREELSILEACLVNRAACHLSLHNYRSCTLDCVSALRLNPQNLKAYYRSSKALLALSKIPEADDTCARGLALDPSNQALQSLASQIIAKNTQIQSQKAKQLEIAQRKQKEAFLLNAALKARGIKTRNTPQPPDMEDAKIALAPDPLDPTSELVFPTVILYPLTLQSDFVKSFPETETLGSRLSDILASPPAWDHQGEYTFKGVECYMETITGGLIKVGKNVTLLKVLSGGNVEVVDGVVRVFVLPKGRAEGWVEEFKMRKKAERGGG